VRGQNIPTLSTAHATLRFIGGRHFEIMRRVRYCYPKLAVTSPGLTTIHSNLTSKRRACWWREMKQYAAMLQKFY
jgi:hypothetical protein